MIRAVFTFFDHDEIGDSKEMKREGKTKGEKQRGHGYVLQRSKAGWCQHDGGVTAEIPPVLRPERCLPRRADLSTRCESTRVPPRPTASVDNSCQ